VARSLTPIAFSSWVDLYSFTSCPSEVTSFTLEEPAGLTLEELEEGLLRVGKDRLKLGLLMFAALELSLNSVR